MTVVVYRDGIIAADTQIVSGDEPHYRLGFGKKLFRIKTGVIAHYGCSNASQRLHRWLAEGEDGDLPSCEHGGVIFFPTKGPIRDISFDCDTRMDYAAPYRAWGTGEKFALAAMWMGADAKKAVEAAMAFDTLCGGKVTVMKRNEIS